MYKIALLIVLAVACRTREIETSLDDSTELSAATTAEAKAEWQKIGSAEFEMAEPPAAGSAVYKSDFKTLKEVQETRTEDDCKLAKSQKWAKFPAMFGKNSEQLTDKEYEKAEALLVKVSAFAERVAGYFKGQYERERPYDVDADLKPCIDPPGGARSYPSSHAAVATADACVLAKMFPTKAKKLKEYGKYLGDLRYIVGVHHPSDVAAGQKLGEDICKRLLSESSFLAEM